MEDLRKRQKDEIKVLKAIYFENFTNLNENGVSPNFKFKITLFPTRTESQYELNKFYVQIDLVVEFTEEYPNEAPLLKFENEKGLSLELVRSLTNQLKHKAEAEKGREIVHDICVDIQEFLYLNNKPPAKSFYEQRLENQLKLTTQETGVDEDPLQLAAKKELAANKAAEDNLLNLEIENAVDEKKKLLQEERKKEKRERLLSNSERPKSTVDEVKDNDLKIQSAYMEELETNSPKLNKKLPQFQPFSIEFSEPQTLTVNCTKLVDFDAENSLYLYRGVDASTNEMLDVYEWRICLEKNNIYDKKKLEMCTSRITKILEEFKNLGRIAASNRILVKYVAYKYYKEVTKNFFIVQIATEYVDGPTMDLFICSNKRPSFVILDSTMRLYLFQLLSALETLHSNHIIHRDLNVF